MESVGNYFKSEFKVHMFLLDSSEPSDFSLSCWQRNRQALPLLLWRGFLFCAALTIMLYSMISYIMNSIFHYWLIYFTHWGLLAIVLMTAFATGISARCYFRGPIDSTFGLPWYVKIYWILYNAAIPLAMLITVFYWSLLYKYNVEEELKPSLDIAVHGLNTVIVLMHLVTCRHPSRILHFHHPLILATLYMIFGVIYHVAGGTDRKGMNYIYPVVNWSRPGPTILLVLLTGVMLLALHMVTVSLASLRDVGTKRIFTKDSKIPEGVPLRGTDIIRTNVNNV